MNHPATCPAPNAVRGLVRSIHRPARPSAKRLPSRALNACPIQLDGVLSRLAGWLDLNIPLLPPISGALLRPRCAQPSRLPAFALPRSCPLPSAFLGILADWLEFSVSQTRLAIPAQSTPRLLGLFLATSSLRSPYPYPYRFGFPVPSRPIIPSELSRPVVLSSLSWLVVYYQLLIYT